MLYILYTTRQENFGLLAYIVSMRGLELENELISHRQVNSIVIVYAIASQSSHKISHSVAHYSNIMPQCVLRG